MPASDVTLLYLIKQVELAVRARLEQTVGPAGLTSLQYTALTVLERHQGLTSAQLARNSFVRAQTMAQMTTFLEGEGLIRRERDPNSGRQFLLYLTDRGRGILDQLRRPVAELEQLMQSALSADDARRLRASLLLCREALSGEVTHL